MGAMSQMVVTGDSHVLLPRINHSKQCHKICYCNSNGVFESCSAMPCLNRGKCTNHGNEINHGSKYHLNCSSCICYTGELRCATLCDSGSYQQIDYQTGKMCHCANHYVPVCGNNGMTYPSSCVARCVGLKNGQYTSGSCLENDPCADNPCGSKKRCLPQRHVCFSTKRKCPQYICVNVNVSCHRQPPLPVCDTEHKEHLNPCQLLQNGKQLSYYGECLHNCLRTGNVCGYNGQTYSSECAARNDKMLIDYRQSCIHQFIPYQPSLYSSPCPGVQCPQSPSQNCHGPVPFGSCCPVCGSVMKLVYSQKLLDRSLDVIGGLSASLTSVLTERLQNHIKTVECELTTYLSIDGSIIAIVRSKSLHPSALQVSACVKEAEKLQSLIDESSPTITMEFPLSALIGAFLIPTTTISTNSVSSIFPYNILNVIILCLFIFYKRCKTI